jgi:dolichyl-phosphate beta-glucosyltransferase
MLLAVTTTTAVTAGLSWIFYPAWLAASEASLAWEEVQLCRDDHITELPESTLLSMVIPAYNEQDRIPIMLRSAHDYLESSKGKALLSELATCANLAGYPTCAGVEWLVVNDGSEDATCQVVRSTFESLKSTASWRLVSLKENSGKGAAVNTGMRLAEGKFRLMVDADGATDFGPGLEQLTVSMTTSLKDKEKSNKNNNKVAVLGSRAHLQEDATTKRSLVRTILMIGFHFFVSLLVSSRIQDTQCGFKLFTRDAAIAVFETLHLRGWAFDTEVIMLCDRMAIQIQEVPVPWQEVDGSKLNTSKLALAIVSLTMLRDMICVRACYTLGIWKEQPTGTT